jgi:hypothetical protein
MLTTAGRNAALGGVTGIVTHVGLIKAITDWRAGTFTEADYTSYARVAITWGSTAASSGGEAREVGNSGALTFPANTGADSTAIGYSLHTASTAGTCEGVALFDSDQPAIGIVSASTDLITAYAHGLSTDQRVFFLKTPGGAAPDVFAENTAYYVLATGLTADVFALSATSGGAAINATTSGVGMFVPYTSQTIAANGSVVLAIGSVKVQI